MSNALFVQAIGGYIISATYLYKDMGREYIVWLIIAILTTLIGGVMQKVGG